MGKYSGKSKLALRPKSTEQVSKILAYCNDRRLAIVPQVSSFVLLTRASKPCRRQVAGTDPCGVVLTPEMLRAGRQHRLGGRQHSPV